MTHVSSSTLRAQPLSAAPPRGAGADGGGSAAVMRKALRGTTFAEGERALQLKEAAATAAPAAASAPAPAESAAAPAADPFEGFVAAFKRPKVKDAQVMAEWDKVEDKTAAPESTVVLAIQKLAPKHANRVRTESGTDLGDAVVAAIIAKNNGDWRGELEPEVNAISTCDDTDPRAKLRTLVRASTGLSPTKWGYKPELDKTLTKGGVAALGQPFGLGLREGKWPEKKRDLPSLFTPTFVWKLAGDKDRFTEIPTKPDGDPKNAHEVTFTVLPKKAGTTELHAEVTAIEERHGKHMGGYVGKASASYTLDVIDAKSDPVGFFEGRFKEAFAEVVAASPFEAVAESKGALAALFDDGQQTALMDYMDTKVVPLGLFTARKQNKASGPQRVLLAANMLTHGKVRMDDKDVDGKKWCASCCGGFAAGVYAYAATNNANGYGALSSEQSIAPTGEKVYGKGKASLDGASNGYGAAMKPHLAEKARLNKAVTKAKSDKEDADKNGTQELGVIADEERERAESERNEKMPRLDAETPSKKVEDGGSITGAGRQNMPYEHLAATLKAGDWIYLDNGCTEGHSVLFVAWKGSPQTGNDMVDGREREVKWCAAEVYHQPSPKVGGVHSTVRIGFPHSGKLDVDGVYAITHARADAQIASTVEDFLSFDKAEALAANKKYYHRLDTALVKKRLHGMASAYVAGMKDKRRIGDATGGVKGGFTPPQQKIVDDVLAGSGDVELDIANLVALCQKLSVINVLAGDPTHPNGKLDQKQYNGGSWEPPLPKWLWDTSLHRVQAPSDAKDGKGGSDGKDGRKANVAAPK